MKRKVLITISSLILLVVLVFSLTACLQIGMKKNNIIKKIEDNNMTMNYVRSTPMTLDYGEDGYKFEDFILATGVVTDVQAPVEDPNAPELPEGSESVEQNNVDSLYIHFAKDDESADWAEEQCKKYLEDNKDTLSKWVVYRFDRVIMCGHYQLVAIIRGY